jgi:hypothetical protein
MTAEPLEKHAITFIDGQNLYFALKESFGYPYPNYVLLRLSQAVCAAHGWRLREARFYIEVRITLDVISLAHRRSYDVAVIFSQDQDLSEVAEEVRAFAQEQNRWIKGACAFPLSRKSRHSRESGNPPGVGPRLRGDDSICDFHVYG